MWILIGFLAYWIDLFIWKIVDCSYAFLYAFLEKEGNLEERDIQIAILVRSIFWNRLKYGAGDLLGNLYKLDIQQEQFFIKGDKEAFSSGVFERKVLGECDRCYKEVLIEVLRELNNVYEKSSRQDPRSFWEGVKGALFEICREEEPIEEIFRPYVKSLQFGNFTGVKCIHVDWRAVVMDWIKELRGEGYYTLLSSAEERKRSVVPDVMIVLGERREKEEENSKALFSSIERSIKKLSFGLATVDLFDERSMINDDRKGRVVQRWMNMSPLAIVDLSSKSLIAYSVFAYRMAKRGDVIGICAKESSEENPYSFLHWPVMLYESTRDLEKRLSLQICDLFDHYEFSGDPDIIL